MNAKPILEVTRLERIDYAKKQIAMYNKQLNDSVAFGNSEAAEYNYSQAMAWESELAKLENMVGVGIEHFKKAKNSK